MVDFVEIFEGDGQLSVALRRERVPVGPGVGRRRPSYGTTWELGRPEARDQLKWLLKEVLKPKGLYVATPCTAWCVC